MEPENGEDWPMAYFQCMLKRQVSVSKSNIPHAHTWLSTWGFFFWIFFLFSFFSLKLEANYFTILYWLCHTSTWFHHGCTRVSHSELPFHLPPHTIPLGHPRAPAQSILCHALNMDWRFVSHMILYIFQCHSPKSSHPHPLPQNPKDCSIHLCLFCCFAYRVIVTIFLNSIYMC